MLLLTLLSVLLLLLLQSELILMMGYGTLSDLTTGLNPPMYGRLLHNPSGRGVIISQCCSTLITGFLQLALLRVKDQLPYDRRGHRERPLV